MSQQSVWIISIICQTRFVPLGELRLPLPQLPPLPVPPTLCPQSQERVPGPLAEADVSDVLPEAKKGLRAGNVSHALQPSFLTPTGLPGCVWGRWRGPNDNKSSHTGQLAWSPI